MSTSAFEGVRLGDTLARQIAEMSNDEARSILARRLEHWLAKPTCQDKLPQEVLSDVLSSLRYRAPEVPARRDYKIALRSMVLRGRWDTVELGTEWVQAMTAEMTQEELSLVTKQRKARAKREQEQALEDVLRSVVCDEELDKEKAEASAGSQLSDDEDFSGEHYRALLAKAKAVRRKEKLLRCNPKRAKEDL